MAFWMRKLKITSGLLKDRHLTREDLDAATFNLIPDYSFEVKDPHRRSMFHSNHLQNTFNRFLVTQ